MKKRFIIFILGVLLASCSTKTSKNKLANYFYPIDKEPIVYLFQDIHNEISERFHRIYTISDSKGKHLVVEIYHSDGRILEAYNYGIDSLNLDDHMIVDRDAKKRQAELFKNRLFPMDKKELTYFASRFPGVGDSTFILQEIERRVNPVKPHENIILAKKKMQTLVFEDNYRTTIFNPFTKEEAEINGRNYSYFAKGYGLVRWRDKDNKSDFQLKKIISEKDWIKFIK